MHDCCDQQQPNKNIGRNKESGQYNSIKMQDIRPMKEAPCALLPAKVTGAEAKGKALALYNN